MRGTLVDSALTTTWKVATLEKKTGTKRIIFESVLRDNVSFVKFYTSRDSGQINMGTGMCVYSRIEVSILIHLRARHLTMKSFLMYDCIANAAFDSIV